MPATAKADPLAEDRLQKKCRRVEETTEEHTAQLQSLHEYILECINTFGTPSFTSLSLLTCVSSHILSSFHAYICILLPIHHSSYHSFLHITVVLVVAVLRVKRGKTKARNKSKHFIL